MAKYNLTANADVVALNGSKDYAIGRLEDLSSSDVISFGDGEIEDVVILTTAGIIDFQAGSNAYGLSGFERLDLAAGSNLVLVTEELLFRAYDGGVSAGWFTVRGNLGDDLVTMIGLTPGGGRMQFVLGGGGNDSFIGTSGNDVVRCTAAELNANDSLDGNGGVLDTIRFDTSGTVDVNAFTNISGFEVIQLNAGGNSVTLANAFGASSQAAASAVAVFSNGGADNIDASATSTPVYFTRGNSSATFQGGSAADKVLTTAAQLNGHANALDGGAGALVLDVLTITGAAAITATAMGGVTGFERIILATAGTSITLAANTATSSTAGFAVIGTAGNDTLDAAVSAVRVGFNPGSGSDSFTGGVGNDQINMTVAQLDATDSFNGGAGTDRIGFGTSGTITSLMLSGLSSIETLALSSSGNNTITLGTNLATVNVVGGIGTDTVTLGLDTQHVSLGAGDDTLIVSAGTAFLSGASDGGAGTDTIATGGPGTISIEAGIVGFEFVTLGGATTVDVVNTVMVLNIGGSEDDDRIILGSVGQTVNAGDGNDFVQNGSGDDMLDGGNGSDWLEVTGPATEVFLAVNTAQLTGYGLDTIINFENLLGAGGVDLLHGDGTANEIDGRGGDDLIEGGGGGDTLTGGPGNDLFRFNDPSAGGATITDYTTGDRFDFALTGFNTTNPLTSISVQNDTTLFGFILAGTNVVLREQPGIGSTAAVDLYLRDSGAQAGGIFVLTDDNSVVQLWYDPAGDQLGGGFEPTLLATVTVTGNTGLAGFTASDFGIF